MNHWSSRLIFVSIVSAGLLGASQVFGLDIVGGLISGASWIMLTVAQICIAFTVFFLQFFITLASYNNYIDVSVVKLGWAMVRDVANMFFVIALLVIAFATILGLEQYEWKKGLVKLIVMAVFINFSNLIAQLVIDAAHVFTITFLNAISATAGGNLINMFKLDKIVSMVSDPNLGTTPEGAGTAVLASSIVATIFAILAAVALGSYVIVMALRVVILWALIIISPLAYLLYALPKGEKYAQQWWSEFFKHVIVAPVMVFFLWLAFATLGSGTIMDEIMSDKAVVPLRQGEEQQSISLADVSTWENMANYLIALVFLMIGLKATQESGAQGSGLVGGAVNFGKKVATYATGYAAGRWLVDKGVVTPAKAAAKGVGKGLWTATKWVGYKQLGGHRIDKKARTFGRAVKGWYWGKGFEETKESQGLQDQINQKKAVLSAAKSTEGRQKIQAEIDHLETEQKALFDKSQDQSLSEAERDDSKQRAERIGGQVLERKDILSAAQGMGTEEQKASEKEIEGLEAQKQKKMGGGFIGKRARRYLEIEKQLGKTQRQEEERRKLLWKRVGSEAGGNILFGSGVGMGAAGVGFGKSGKYRIFGDIYRQQEEVWEKDKDGNDVLDSKGRKVQARDDAGKKKWNQKYAGSDAQDRIERGWLKAEEMRSASKDREYETRGTNQVLEMPRIKFNVFDRSFDYEEKKGTMQERISMHDVGAQQLEHAAKNLEAEAKLKIVTDFVKGDSKIQGMQSDIGKLEAERSSVLTGARQKQIERELEEKTMMLEGANDEQRGLIEKEMTGLGEELQSITSGSAVQKVQDELDQKVGQLSLALGIDPSELKDKDGNILSQSEMAKKITDKRAAIKDQIEKLEAQKSQVKGNKAQRRIEDIIEKKKEEGDKFESQLESVSPEELIDLQEQLKDESSPEKKEERAKIIEERMDKLKKMRDGVDKGGVEHTALTKESADLNAQAALLSTDAGKTTRVEQIEQEIDEKRRLAKQAKKKMKTSMSGISYDDFLETQAMSKMTQDRLSKDEERLMNDRFSKKYDDALKLDMGAGHLEDGGYADEKTKGQLEKINGTLKKVEARLQIAKDRQGALGSESMEARREISRREKQNKEEGISAEVRQENDNKISVLKGVLDANDKRQAVYSAEALEAIKDKGKITREKSVITDKFKADADALRGGDARVADELAKKLENEAGTLTDKDKSFEKKREAEQWRRISKGMRSGGTQAWDYAASTAQNVESSRGFRYKHNLLLSEAEQRVVWDKRGLDTPKSTLTELIEEFERNFGEMSYESYVENSSKVFLEMMDKVEAGTFSDADRASLAGLFKRGFNESWVDDTIISIMSNNEARHKIGDVLGWKDMDFTVDKIRDVEMFYATGDIDFARDNVVISETIDEALNSEDKRFKMSLPNLFEGLKTGNFRNEAGHTLDTSEVTEFKGRIKGLFAEQGRELTDTQKDLFDALLSAEGEADAETKTLRTSAMKTYMEKTEKNQSSLQFFGNLRNQAIDKKHGENAGWALNMDVGDGKNMYIGSGRRMAEAHVYSDINKTDARFRAPAHPHMVADLTEEDGQVVTRVREDAYGVMRKGIIDPNSWRGTQGRYISQMSGLSAGEDAAKYRNASGQFAVGKSTAAVNTWRKKYRSEFEDRTKGKSKTEIKKIEEALSARQILKNVYLPQMKKNSKDFLLTMAAAADVDGLSAVTNGEMRLSIPVYDEVSKQVKEIPITNYMDLKKHMESGVFGFRASGLPNFVAADRGKAVTDARRAALSDDED